MKKTSKIVALVVCLALVVAATVVLLAACNNGKTYTGDCYYDMTYGENTTRYGAKVDVQITDEGEIKSVKLYTDDKSGYVRTTKSWKDDLVGEGQLGFDETEAAYDQWIKDNFVGKNVNDVMAYQATATAAGQAVVSGPKMAGATQSSARVIVAVQDAIIQWVAEHAPAAE